MVVLMCRSSSGSQLVPVRGAPDLAGVPETARVIQIPGCRAGRCRPVITQHGRLAGLHVHVPLIWAALF
jgi:hypothetical protein